MSFRLSHPPAKSRRSRRREPRRREEDEGVNKMIFYEQVELSSTLGVLVDLLFYEV